MLSHLDSLQQSIFEKLRTLPELTKIAVFKEEVFTKKQSKIFDQGMIVKISIPLPLSASKYSAGPAFGKVAIRIAIEVYRNASASALSPLYLGELISSKLHNWNAPLSSSYGKLSLDSQKPWELIDNNSEKISIFLNFNTQSVLEL